MAVRKQILKRKSNRVIILEGPDGGGKTTIANKYAEDFGGVVIHEGPPPPGTSDLLTYYSDKLRAACESNMGLVIFDRLYLGEHVYGPVHRDQDRLGKAGVQRMCNMCIALGVEQFICLPPYAIARANYQRKMKEADDYLKNVDKWHEVYYRYVGLCTSPFIPCDYTKVT